MTPDEAASTLGSLVRRGLIVASSFFMNSTGDVNVGGITDGKDFLRKRCMMDEAEGATKYKTPLPPL